MTIQETCVVCGGEVERTLDLLNQPLANRLLDEAAEEFTTYWLCFVRCPRCTHGQLAEFVDPKVLFSHYLYESGTSTTLRNFFSWFASSLVADDQESRSILEIASNDGSLLSQLASVGFNVIGIDPAANLNAIAKAAGHDVITGFFPDAAPDRQFDIIVAMNVAAHTPTPLEFMSGVANSLAPNGVAIIQTSQAMMLANGEFDTIYHEHYSFYTVASMTALAARAGLRVERTRLVSVHGTSFLFFLRHQDYRGISCAFEGGQPYEVAFPEVVPAFLSDEFSGDGDPQKPSLVLWRCDSLTASDHGASSWTRSRFSA